MVRSAVIAAFIATTGVATAQPPVIQGANNQIMGPWPPGAGADREAPTVSARATGYATGTSIYRGRVGVQRRAANRDEAGAALEKVMDEVKAIGGVELRIARREASRMTYEPAQMAQYVPGQPPPTIPQRNQTTPVFLESATFEVEAPTRKAISDWAAKIPPVPPSANQTQPFPPTPAITERLPENDPAWAQATRTGLAAAERDARNAAEAAGGELGRLVGVWTERLNYVSDGYAQVLVTAEYQIAKPKR